MKFRNRILSLVLVLGMVLPNFALAAHAEEPEETPAPDTTIVIWEAETVSEDLEEIAEQAETDVSADSKESVETVETAAISEAVIPSVTEIGEEPASEKAGAKMDGTDSGDPAPNGRQSGKTIDITDWKYNPMATNSQYQELRFTFTSEEDQTVYEGYIGGIRLYFLDGVDKNETINKLLTDVADSFYAEQSFKLSDSEAFKKQYGMTVQPIDAEKVHEKATDEHPTTDANLCWAASTSNMLQLTGWGARAGEQFKTEDDLFDYFEAAYTDHGTSQEHGTKWFFNGIFGEQKTDENGEVIYVLENEDTRTQERLLPDSRKLGGLLLDYAEETVEKHYEVRDGDGYDALVDAALNMTNGTATGLGIFMYDLESKYLGGHAITLMGYIRDTVEAGIDSLKALFISDSDNNKHEKSNREDAVDSVTMVSLNDVNYMGTMVKELGNYKSDTFSVLLDYTTLEPFSDSVPKESSGSRDPLTNVDYSAERTEVRKQDDSLVQTATVGDEVVLSCTMKNISYVKQDVSCKPYAVMTYYVYCNGEVVQSSQVSKYLDDSTPIAQKANQLNIITLDTLRLTSPGDYTVSYQIDGLYYTDASGNAVPITEAYTLNNISRNNYSFRVEPANAVPAQPAAEQTAQSEVPVIGTTLPTYSEVFVKPTGAPSRAIGSAFKVHLAAVTTVKINLEEDGEAIPANAYSVKLNADGSVTVTFTNSFIRSLTPGTHRFRVLGENGNPLAYIVLTIR